MAQTPQAYLQSQPEYYGAPTSSSLTGPMMYTPANTSSYHTAVPAPGAYPYQQYGFFSAYPPTGLSGTLPLNGAGTIYTPSSTLSKRPIATQFAEPNVSDGPSPPKRTRHCSKCGSKDCKGKGGRNLCPNPCQDCGRLTCMGRNSRHPNKKCQEAWS